MAYRCVCGTEVGSTVRFPVQLLSTTHGEGMEQPTVTLEEA